MLTSSDGSSFGNGAVGIVLRKVSAPNLFEKKRWQSGGPTCCPPDVICLLLCVRGVVTEDEGGGGENLEVCVRASVLGQASLHVGVEGLACFEGSVSGEDGVCLGGTELASFVGVTCLQQNWVPLWTPRNFEAPGDVELPAGVLELADLLVGGKKYRAHGRRSDDRCSNCPTASVLRRPTRLRVHTARNAPDTHRGGSSRR